MKWFFIRPFDTLFFRDARPFIAGEDNLAQSIFPPAPSVTYGAIRTVSLIHAGVDLLKFAKGVASNLPAAAGTKAEFGTLYLIGPIPAWRSAEAVNLLFPSPLNLIYKEASRDQDLEFLLPEAPTGNTNLSLSLNLCIAQEKVKSADRYYLLSDQAFGLLAGIIPRRLGDLTNQEAFWKLDHRVGIARTNKRTAEEGMLYSSQHIQINNMDRVGGLVVKVLDGENDLPPKGVLQLGGEKRFCEFEEVSLPQPTEYQIEKIAEKISKNQRFFLWLISPAVFSNKEYAFIPGFIDHQTLVGQLDNQEVKLVGCQVGRAVSIGGWNIAENRHKPMRRAVPEGSIYFFEFNNKKPDNMKQFVANWMLRPIPGQMPDYEKQGFGTILIGGY